MAELLAEGDVGPAVSEQVTRELGEVGQQLARLLRLCVDLAGDGGERVVDEVRRDLRPQRPQLGLGEALVLRGDHRQLNLCGDQACRLLDDPQFGVGWASDGAIERDQSPGSLALDQQRREHRGAQRASRVRGRQAGNDLDPVVSGAGQQP